MIIDLISLVVSLANSAALGWLVYSYRCYARGYIRGATAAAADPIVPVQAPVLASTTAIAPLTPRSIAKCSVCEKSVARWQLSATGPVCVNCQPL